VTSRRGHADLGHDAETAATAVVAPRGAPAALRAVVIEGPDAGRALFVDPNAPARILIGTSPACELRLTDPTVSRRHFALERAGHRTRLTDLGSTNGTFVDGVCVVDAFVMGGELVRCGSTAIRLDAAQGKAGALTSAMRFGHVIGASEAMRRLYPLCERLAMADVPVVIEGETGTGKENLAESLHERSRRSAGPFVVFDCTTVSPALVEAELFGHERGAFTGAVAGRPGVFELASGGTLFIDEIGDLEPPLQPKLLRAIDRGEVRRVGGQKPIRVDARVIAATRRDLDREVAAGRFRDDLFHRLAVGRIELPPLRDRRGDVQLLTKHFAEQLDAPAGAVTADVIARFEDYGWPGNVRELRNAVARLVALGDVQLRGERPPAAGGGWVDEVIASGAPYPIARRRVLDEFERRYVEHVLRLHGGNVAKAAAASGIALRYFQIVKARGAKSGA
jgi:transcriptional regulator with GAF, ATPase, and Fis domain